METTIEEIIGKYAIVREIVNNRPISLMITFWLFRVKSTAKDGYADYSTVIPQKLRNTEFFA